MRFRLFSSMHPITPLLVMSALFISQNAIAAPKGTSADKPLNVLMIIADDLRVELGCYGQTHVQSPNLDRLAQRSLRFERAYCQQAVCNPSRSSFMSGMSVDALGFYDLTSHLRRRHPDAITLPQKFKEAGYETRGIGKTFHNFREPSYEGDELNWSEPQLYHYGRHGDDVVTGLEKVPADLVPIPRAERRDVPDDAYFDGRIATKSIEVLREVKDKPFFMAVGFWKPHLPFNAPAKYWDLYDRDNLAPPANPEPPQDVLEIALHDSRELMRDFKNGLTDDDVITLRHGYYAAISYMDAQIGRVLDELDRLELTDNTIIVFFSDHGFHLGEHDLWCKTSNFELDARVPLLISVPQQKTAGQSTASFAELIDIYPTLVDLCGLKAPPQLNGKSLTPVLADASASVRDNAITQHPRPPYKSKGVWPQVMGHSIRTDHFRYTEWKNIHTGDMVGRELYDHRSDPRETKNLANDSEWSETVSRHADLLDQRALEIHPAKR